MIAVESLTKVYGRRHAVDHIDFHADRGEIVGFLGPNGAGKTTTMRILSGFMPPTSGKASVGGFDVVEQSLEVRKRVGYLPETVPLYTDMTVYDYLTYMGKLHKVEDVEDRVEDVLEMVNMESRIDSFISSLSKGMRQRIGLAQALIHDPDVLILDEPTIGLDPAQIIEIRHLIRELGAEHTILLSTHILSEVQQLCDRILVINRGKIVAEGTPKNLEQRLAGAGRVSLQVLGAAEGLAGVVQKVPGVQSILHVEDGNLEFMTAPGAESRPAVAKAVVGAGYDLVEIRSVGMSLEQIFLELTAEDPALSAGAFEPEEPRASQGETEDEDEE
jgi:ABC-2 type transport system ATP-binding protein